MDIRVAQLEEAIRNSIVIPQSIQSNCRVVTTGIGGVFIEFFSDISTRLTALNSKVQFKISFDTTNVHGGFEGTDIGVEMYNCRGITTPMRGVKKKKPYMEVVIKVNRWLSDNELYLFNNTINR